MKIERIDITSFVGLRRLDVALDAPVTLVAGPNGSGKTSLVEAVRFALLGGSPRVGLKKELPALLNDGARDGHVWVTVDGRRIGRSVRTGNPVGAGDVEAMGLPYVLGAQRFADLPVAERRRFLFGLFGVAVSPDGVADELRRRGHGPERIERVKPLLRGGFDAAAREAAAQASEARGAWRAVTGEAYGAKKAESWAAELPSVPDGPPDLAAAQEVYDGAVRAHGMALARRQAYERAVESAGRLRALAATVERCRADVARAERETGGVVGSPAGRCPSCGVDLAVAGGALVPASECSAAAASSGVEGARRRLREAEEAAAALPEVERTLQQCGGQQGGAVEAVDRARQALESARAAAVAYDAAVERRAAAERRTATAMEHHEDAVAWSALEAELLPDGLPATLLARALGPFNERLVASHTATGWPLVQVAADMGITAGGRAYGLLSESERWRADAVLAEAIAHAAGLRLLVLDRFDVLDIPSRGQFVRWLAGLSAEYETIIAAGTLKAPPGALPLGVAAIWLGPAVAHDGEGEA